MNAKEYKKLLAKKRQTETLLDVTLPSGAVWKMRLPNAKQFIMSGVLPATLTAKIIKLEEKYGKNPKEFEQALTRELTEEEYVQNLTLSRDLLLHSAVEPQISLNPKTDNEIHPTDIDPIDFEYLLGWVNGGGRALPLDNFLKKS